VPGLHANVGPMARVDRAAPVQFLSTVFEPEDWVAIFLKSYDRTGVAQRVGPVSWVQSERVQRWLRAMNARKYNVYVAWNQAAFFLLFRRQFAPCSHGAASVMEKEVRMPVHDIHWSQYPRVADNPTGRAWLMMQAGRNLAKHTVETYGRSMEDFLRFTAREEIRLDQATREHLAAYVRDLLVRTNPRQPKVVHLESGAGLSNATVLLRLSVVRLFYDYLVLEGLRPTNPVGRMHWHRRYGHWPGDAPLVRRHRKLPWIPTEEQWQAILAAMQHESPRNRAMFALSYDAALRRQEVVRVNIGDLDPAHRLIRIPAENAKNGCERVVPYAEPTARLLAAYLDHRRQLTREGGRLFVSFSHRNLGQPISVWTWAKTITNVALVSGVGRFTTHTLRHLCLTDLARAGWDIHEIAAFAGHRSLASTLQYIHVSGRELSAKLATTMSSLHMCRVQQLAEVRS
jgi:integrase/recombinase XerD